MFCFLIASTTLKLLTMFLNSFCPTLASLHNVSFQWFSLQNFQQSTLLSTATNSTRCYFETLKIIFFCMLSCIFLILINCANSSIVELLSTMWVKLVYNWRCVSSNIWNNVSQLIQLLLNQRIHSTISHPNLTKHPISLPKIFIW